MKPTALLLSLVIVATGSQAIASNKDLDLFENPEINAPTQRERDYWKGSSFYLVDRKPTDCPRKASAWLWRQLGVVTPHRNNKKHFYVGGRKRQCYAVTWSK
jgi:hypothetical protein